VAGVNVGGPVVTVKWITRAGAARILVAALIFATLTALIFWRYFDGTYLAGSDAMGPFYDLEMMKAEGSFFSSWRNVTGLGYLNFPSPTLSGFFYITVGVLNINVAFLWKMMIIISFWAAGFLMFVCAYRLSGNYLAGIVAGFVYVLNQVFLSQVTEVHHYFILGYALFPLLFLAFYRAVDGSGRYSLLTLPAIALIYGTISAPHTVLITGVFILLFTLAYLWFSRSESKEGRWDRLGLGVVCVLLVVLPMVLMNFSGGGTQTLDVHYSIEEAKSYSSYSLYHSLVLAASENTFIKGTAGGEWVYPSFLLPLGLALAVVIPIVALLSLKVRAKRPMILALIVLSVLFIFLAKGPNPPGGEIFSLAFSNIPLMDSIRVYSRFHLLTGFAYALLIAMVVANLDDVRTLLPRLHGRLRRVANRLLERKVLSILIVVAMVLPSSAIFLAEEPRSFDLPSEYAEPYLWLRDQAGTFRVLNLPYQQVYYTSGDGGVDGYPSTMTLDVGMYSPFISNKAYAYGVETEDFWSFLGSTLEDRRFGYKDIPQMLGGMANVRYIVSQVQTTPEESALFASLNGVSLRAAFEGGAVIYEDGQWATKLHALDGMYLLVGNRADLITAMGLGLVDFTTDGVLLISDIQGLDGLAKCLERMDMVVLTDTDLLSLAAKIDWPEAVTVDLSSLADPHTTQTDETWVRSNAYYYSGIASGLTADTSGVNKLEAVVNADEACQYDILLSMIEGPESGKMSIMVDGETTAIISPHSSYSSERWVRISNITLDEGQHSVVFASDGSGNCSLGQMILVPHTEVEDRLALLNDMLAEHSDKVAYMIGANSHLWSDGTYFPWTGSEGQGIASEVQITATAFQDPILVVDDNAYGGFAVTVDPRGRTYSPTFRGLVGGSNYTVSLSVNNPGNTSTSSQIEIWGGSNGTLSLLYVSSMVVSPGEEYQEQSIHFTLPEGTDCVQVQVYAGETGLLIDRLTMTPQEQVTPKNVLNLQFADDYLLRMAGGDGNVTIDGTVFPYTSYADGIYTYDVGFLAEGKHVMEVGNEGVYAFDLIPFEAENASSAASVSYERLSNVEYQVTVSSDGPVWLLLSESYNSLWSAEIDGVVLDHVKVDSMVNAFYVPEGGNHTVTIRFLGQDTYGSIIITLLVMLVLATAIFALVLMLRTRPWLFRRKKE
jgi:hypothetical protein